MKPKLIDYLQMTDSEKQSAILDMTVEEAKQLGNELHMHDQLHAPARARPELEVQYVSTRYGFILSANDGSVIGWDGELIPTSSLSSRQPHISVFVSSSAAIYFAGLHEWVVRNGTV